MGQVSPDAQNDQNLPSAQVGGENTKKDSHNGIPFLYPRPSENYQTSEKTLVYRLSELTFGSILAAYILGFISFAANSISVASRTPIFVTYIQDDFDWTVPIQIIIYVLISATYSYLTAAMYMHYHTGILTMPSAAVQWSRLDFTIAVGQAFLFGISMLVPQAFSLCIALVLWAAFLRQNRESHSLARKISRILESRSEEYHLVTHPGNRDADDEEAKQKALLRGVEATIKKGKLEGWKPISYIKAVILTAVGIPLSILPFLEWISKLTWFGFIPVPSPNELLVIYFASSLILTGFVIVAGYATLKKGAGFIHDEKGFAKLDEQYRMLDLELQQHAGLIPK